VCHALNELKHLFHYGPGTLLGNTITVGTPGPFSNIQNIGYWSSTDFGAATTHAWYVEFGSGGSSGQEKTSDVLFSWAVHDGDVSAVPVPAAVWLFGSALGLLGWIKRKSAYLSFINPKEK